MLDPTNFLKINSYFSIALIILGGTLILFSIHFIYKQLAQGIYLTLLIGFGLCLSGAALNYFRSFEITKDGLKIDSDPLIDLVKGNTQPLNADIQNLRRFTEELKVRLDGLSSKGKAEDISITKPAPALAQVYIFYAVDRADDVATIQYALQNSNFDVTSVPSLSGVTLKHQPIGGLSIDYTERGAVIARGKLANIVRSALERSDNKEISIEPTPYPLRRGDAQIYLYPKKS